MVSTVLLRSENELREFYEWLLWRAQEEEDNNNKNHALLYRNYAGKVKIEMNHY